MYLGLRALGLGPRRGRGGGGGATNVPGTGVLPPITFNPGTPIPNQTPTVGTPFDQDISGFFQNGAPPILYEIFSGGLPPGLALNGGNGHVTGTPTTPGNSGNVVFKATDGNGNSANSNGVNFTTYAAGLAPLQLLLHFDGANGSTVITDSSGTNKTCAVSGTASLSTASSVSGGSSLRLTPGVVGSVTALNTDGGFDTGSGDFTAQGWFWSESGMVGHDIFSRRSDSSSFCPWLLNRAPNTGELRLLVSNPAVNGWTVSLAIAVAPSPYAWHHIALVKTGSLWTVYIDGIARPETATHLTVALSPTNLPFRVGTTPSLPVGLYVDEVSFHRVALWTANFTPPLAPPPPPLSMVALLHFDGANGSTVITDSSAAAKVCTISGTATISTAQSVFGGASLRLNAGVVGSVEIPNDGVFDTGSGDFTAQARFRFDSVAVGHDLFSRRLNSGSFCPWLLAVALNELRLFVSNPTVNGWDVALALTPGLLANTWYHIALVKSGSLWTVYINGVARPETATKATVATPLAPPDNPLRIGTVSSQPAGLYIDEFAFHRQALWTANFTPPAVPYLSASHAFDIAFDQGAFA